MAFLIAAQSSNGYIGKNGSLPWKHSSEMKFFKAMTIDQTVLMGRTTFESMGSKPLKDRVNIVVSRTYKPLKEAINDSLDNELSPIFTNELRRAIITFTPNCFVIGGAKIYKQVMDEKLVSDLYISKFDFEVEGDVKFPEIPECYQVIDILNKEGFSVYHYKLF